VNYKQDFIQKVGIKRELICTKLHLQRSLVNICIWKSKHNWT